MCVCVEVNYEPVIHVYRVLLFHHAASFILLQIELLNCVILAAEVQL